LHNSLAQPQQLLYTLSSFRYIAIKYRKLLMYVNFFLLPSESPVAGIKAEHIVTSFFLDNSDRQRTYQTL